jgi:hypothetical protein
MTESSRTRFILELTVCSIGLVASLVPLPSFSVGGIPEIEAILLIDWQTLTVPIYFILLVALIVTWWLKPAPLCRAFLVLLAGLAIVITVIATEIGQRSFPYQILWKAESVYQRDPSAPSQTLHLAIAVTILLLGSSLVALGAVDLRGIADKRARMSMAYSRRPRHLVLWSLMIACVLGLLGFVVWGYFEEYKLDSRGYFLIIHVECQRDRPKLVACIASFRLQQAQATADKINQYSFENAQIGRTMDSVVSDPFEGQPLKMENVYYHHTSYFGRTLSWSQNSFLAVYAEWPDGRKMCKVLEIPDARISKEMTIRLP